MKNKVGILVCACAALIAVGAIWLGFANYQKPAEPKPEVIEKFHLEPELYEGSQLKEITADEFASLIQNKKSFIVIAHMDFCPAETPLTTTTEQFVAENGLTIYALKSDIFKQTELADSVKYLPSAAIYRQGELIKYLNAESDEDIPFYQSAENFRNWLSKYINLSKE